MSLRALKDLTIRGVRDSLITIYKDPWPLKIR